MKRVKKPPKEKPRIVQIKEADGAVKKIGKYYPEEKLFKCDRAKSEHFMNKYNGWGLDAKVVDYLISQNADVLLKDTESKWEFRAFSGDFKIYGKLDEFDKHRPQYFLSIDHWTVERGRQRSYVHRCQETTCAYNFATNCVRGVISIGEDGQCAEYNERG
jgi:hypothetical protein